MKLEKLFALQSQLDEHIIKTKKLTKSQQMTDKKVIAFKVEFGEFLNEVKDFKFWSNKPMSEKEVVLEEFVDGIHFLLTVALDRKYDRFIHEVKGIGYVTVPLDDLSLGVFNLPLNSAGEVKNAFEMMLAIAHKLGFSEEDILAAYDRKNGINHDRQDQGY
ncbi:nucleoside triphosphate pyrophosphohydrolase [Bacillus phage Slash]|uniref:dUTPase n=3 Tax=Slashvirus TaxID=1921709 RepID=U5PWD7_9CAUD|nr:nucleoside triphosphate pyrophosphohydrolase [Bacillus phage Staley]YP_008771928.1 nucleoside triphosphate pyrophosphohydrolase [Bacillus phage Slash]YP_009203630.1 nucleoside triphosphate pyrophosphohydrolase [Bacillus phage Stahl]AGY48315.1 dUTPase [Bacillus phage Slash]AGY48709.1 dUTPase [Bacillus phage Staley]AKA61454.1 dUTPase [Bacillus phage Stahl]